LKLTVLVREQVFLHN